MKPGERADKPSGAESPERSGTFEPIIDRTTEELRKIDPDCIVPCHCTGKNAIAHMEQAMPDRFIFNMSGTKLTFSA